MFRRTLVLMLILLFMVVSSGYAQEDTLGLSAGDFALFNAANAATAELSAFQFEFALNFAAEGLDEGDYSLDLTGNGALDQSALSPALQVVINGSADVPEPTPVDGELRLVDGILYANGFTALAGVSGWQGMSANDFTSAFESGFAAGFEQGSGMPLDTEALSEAVALALTALDPGEFIAITRLNDETLDGVNTTHFRTSISLSDFTSSDTFAALLSAVANASGMSASEAANLQAAAPMFGVMFADTTITFDQYFGEDDDLLHRAVLNFELKLDPAQLGLTEEVTFVLNFEITLSDHDQPQTIAVPDDVEMISALPTEAALVAPTVAVPTVVVPTVIVPTTPPVEALPSATPLPTTVAATTVSEDTQTQTLTLTANVPTTIELTGGAVDLRYAGSANEIISVTARSLEIDGVLDTTVEVLDDSETRLAFNDDHGSNRSDLASFDSLIQELKLLNSGDVIVRVSTFSGVGAGQVEVLVTSSSAPAPTEEPVSTETVTEDGAQVVTGVVPNNDSYTHTLNAESGDVLTITVRATDNALDPKVALIDSRGAVVTQNDDHGTDDTSLGRFDSRIVDFAVAAGGTYTIQITGFGGSGGSFELTIERSTGSANATATPGTEIVIDPTDEAEVQTVRDRIGPGSSFTYHFEAEAGDVYTITAMALDEDFDPRVAVYDGRENFLISNDDHGTSDTTIAFYDARIYNLILPETGDYVVHVNGYQDSAGEFELSLERVARGAPLGRGSDQVFTGDVRANGTFTQSFEAQAGDYITITARALSQDFDPRLSLLSPDGVIIADNDDHGTSAADIGFLDSRIHNYYVSATGTYTIEVQGFRGSAGSFAVTVTTLR